MYVRTHLTMRIKYGLIFLFSVCHLQREYKESRLFRAVHYESGRTRQKQQTLIQNCQESLIKSGHWMAQLAEALGYETGRSRVPFPVGSVDFFFNNLILPAAL